MRKPIVLKAGFCLSVLMLLLLPGLPCIAQTGTATIRPIADSNHIYNYDYYKSQLDLIDITYKILRKKTEGRLDSSGTLNTDLYYSISPIVEYSTATGFSPGIAGNVAFLTSAKEPTNTSSILGAVKYTTKKQFLLPFQSSIWAPGNKYNFLGDWRFLDYPQDAYGIGSKTTNADKYIISYRDFRLYEMVIRAFLPNLYAGLGYHLDYHWGIQELDLPPGRVTDFQKYGFNKSSISSGATLNLLYDSRKNSINPEGGSFYANLQFLQNSTIIGSSTNWNSILLDLRKYIKMPHNNVLAFWLYSVFTLSGNPPYLDLPGTGSDAYNNTGRGYEQARFVGKNMVDLEAEFRFGITKNGLIGAVVFCNAETVSELNNSFQVISPGIGIGLRIKFNKFSKTNACIDYGLGANGSRGFVGNLGEVF